jgi:hypothetical protein
LSSRKSPETSLDGAVDNFVRAGIFPALFTYLPVALDTKIIDLRKHSGQQLFPGLGWNACPLKRPNFPALPIDLAAHVFDFVSEGGEVHPAIVH